MTFKYRVVAAALAALAVNPAAFAQTTPPQAGQAGETSDRTPDKATQTPQNQKDTADGKTSDRSPNNDVKVQHQPGAAGTAGSESSEGASSGTSGNTTAPPTSPPPASSGTGE
jgi:hypothetical protein